jgi:hypothetical protein
MLDPPGAMEGQLHKLAEKSIQGEIIAHSDHIVDISGVHVEKIEGNLHELLIVK